MFDFLKRKYQEGKIGVTELEIAVEEIWITQEQMDKIISESK